ncbi:MAG: NAD(P)H-dependent glycerol-3-phosphate dehydrogenase [Erysipelotrichaceae bacterium]|nr:NAD(P)H-dependent glycerol-3-phosphate dehydrogenase [Erysipelotrichaceae bacterium]
MKIVVIGSGSWGTALAQVLVDNHKDCMIYGNNLDEVVDIHLYHRNDKYFPGVNLHTKLDASNDIQVLKDADIVIMSVPTGAVETVCNQIQPVLTKPVIVVNTAKGFHPVTHERMSQVITRCMDPDKLVDIVSLIGPSHAEEVVRRMLTTVNAVCENLDSAKIIQELFSNEYFRVYHSSDVIGSETAVAIKNIIALGSGIATGLGLGDNARAGLMTRGLAEMARYGVAMGGEEKTYMGLCGVGDLIVTCTSVHSRNFQAGLTIGQANSAKPFWDTNTKTVEGVKACEAVYKEALKLGIDMPITTEIYRVLYEGEQPSECILRLMTRELKHE